MSTSKKQPSSPGVRRAPSLVDMVTDGLTEQITSGQFSPGQVLPSVQALSDTWNVSRTVMREALSRMSANGLVVSQQGRGVFVAEVLPTGRLEFSTLATGDNLARIIELRMAIESEAAALAALHRTDEDLAEMQQALDQMESGIRSGDVPGGINADVAFHCSICVATGNEHFSKLFVFLNQSLYENISVSRRNSATSGGRGNEAQHEHQAIFDAIKDKNLLGARRAARVHIANTASRLGLELPDTEPDTSA